MERRFNKGGGSGRPPFKKRRDDRFSRQDRQDRRPSRKIPEGFSLYYMAIVCPEPVNDRVRELKSYMNATYGCEAASKSPAHLTIVPPFRAEDELEKSLKEFAEIFSMGILPFEVKLDGIGQFGDRVLFINADGGDSLQNLEKECMAEFEEKFPSILFGMKPEFHPHVTIATRDIPEGKIDDARNYLEREFNETLPFEVRDIRVLKLEKGYWNIV